MEEAAAGVPTVLVRGGDGVVFTVQARRLAELAPLFPWDLPAIESPDIYDIVQDYRITVRGFTDPATGELLDRYGLAQNVDAIFGVMVPDLDTLRHLARAAIDLRMNDLFTDCFKKLLEFLQNAPGHL
ncbi:hypothetical protein E2562_036444 [Oryza meyeriana var. granulata]|uniref:Uncharacterized protein n=1 Tax=Oryza meyeriana var. granulata TaxID=110450 RepID=A0A6G1BQM9_9ORYZ|nr:hypothetical protein E2562_036444 [Oryza meyeriana var. granulata]